MSAPSFIYISLLTVLAEERDQALSKRVREDELGSDNQDLPSAPVERPMTHLRGQTLEERANALVLDHFLDDRHTADLRAEVGVLDTRLDDVEGRGDGDGCDRSGDGRDEVWDELMNG